MSKKGYTLFVFVIFAFFLMPIRVHAYLDPGTGGMLIQIIFGAILAAGTFIGVFWTRLKKKLLRKTKNNGQAHMDSESKDKDLKQDTE